MSFHAATCFAGCSGGGSPRVNRPRSSPASHRRPAKRKPRHPARRRRSSAAVGHSPVLRPPGAIEESAFLATCTRCNACAQACPHDAITVAPARLRGAAGTPVLNPIESPCRMCAELPCVAACEPLALRFGVPVKMGTATISVLDCLAHQNTTCSVCVEQCPVEGALAWENGRPVVNPGACTGCGVCQYACPAPRNAVMILPVLTRPTPKPETTHATGR